MTLEHKCVPASKPKAWIGLFAAASLGLAGCATREPAPGEVLSGQEAVQAGLPVASARLDKVPPVPAPRFTEDTPLPAPAARRAEQMPAYNAAQVPVAPESMNLEQAYMAALQNDPQLRGAYQELQAVGFGVNAARAGLLPNVYGEYNRTRNSQNVVESENQYYRGGKASWNDTNWALTLVQPIFDLGAYQKWKQAQEAERKEVATYAYAQQDLMLRTATAYLSILAAQDQIELTEAEHQLTDKQMEVVQARFDSGQATKVGVSEVQARLDIQRSNILLARNDLQDKQQALQEILGQGNFKLQPVRKDLAMLPPSPNDMATWLSTALEQNWSIRAAAASITVAEKEVEIQKAGYYPNLALRASTGRNDTGGSLFGGGSTVKDNRIMLTLNVPIFQGGYTSNMSKAAASRLDAASTDLSRARRQVQRQVSTAFQNINTGIERVKALNSSVDAFAQTLDFKQQGYKAGLNDIVSVLDASRNLYNAKRQQAEANYNFVLDGIKLKQAAGTLNAADIAAISQQMN